MEAEAGGIGEPGGREEPEGAQDGCGGCVVAHLLRHGMFHPSFIPEKATRKLRELTRRRKKLIGWVAQERNRVQKQREYGNVKLGNALSDVFGLSGQLMLKALVDEDKTPEQIAELAQGSLRKKQPEIAAALRGSAGAKCRKSCSAPPCGIWHSWNWRFGNWMLCLAA